MCNSRLWFIAVIRVGFDPVMYAVSETEGVVTVCISAMDILTEGTLSVTLTTEPVTASGMFTKKTCSVVYITNLLFATTHSMDV